MIWESRLINRQNDLPVSWICELGTRRYAVLANFGIPDSVDEIDIEFSVGGIVRVKR